MIEKIIKQETILFKEKKIDLSWRDTSVGNYIIEQVYHKKEKLNMVTKYHGAFNYENLWQEIVNKYG